MTVQEHTSYKNARRVAEIVWKTSKNWDHETLKTIGNQVIRSADSISANLAEGWSRYTKRDKINFFIIARGSAGETLDWIEKAFNRRLINPIDYSETKQLLLDLPKEINGLIKGVNQNLKH